MRKRRSTVYVRPGKDVTLYVPVETPEEVIDYLNQLKQEGTFSQGVMDIVTQYVQQQQVYSNSMNHDDLSIVAEALVASIDSDDYSPSSELVAIADSGSLARSGEETHFVDGNFDSPQELASVKAETVNHKLDVAQIFRQAQRNAGKMASDTNA